MRRRDFLAGASVAGAALATRRPAFAATNATTPAPGLAAATGRRPNVILIVSDDQGAVDLGCYGSSDIATPSLDALAARGVRLTQFYVAAPICSPSRAALLTGRYPLRCGVLANAARKGGLPAREVTLARLFKGAGYATAYVGKWHLGSAPEFLPTAQGFDTSFGFRGGCIDNWSHEFHWVGPSTHDLYRNETEVFENGRYFPDLMLEEAQAFLRTPREQPYFLYFASNLPHYPYQPDRSWRERYRDTPDPRGLYAATVSTMDERVGRLLATVDALGQRESTIVVFLSDNGHSTEERAHFGGGSAGPYRGAKFSLFEGGIRMPAIVSWPGQLPVGATRAQLTHACDLFPTLAELCGVAPASLDLDGGSLTGVLRDAAAPSPHGVLHWHLATGGDGQWAIRDGDWKLMRNPRDTGTGREAREAPELFLARLSDDPGERQNRVTQHPEIVRRLTQIHEEWYTRSTR